MINKIWVRIFTNIKITTYIQKNKIKIFIIKYKIKKSSNSELSQMIKY